MSSDPSQSTARAPVDGDGLAGDGFDEDGSESDRSDGEGSDSGRTGRDVVVPDRVYKTVTVFSTLFAVVTVVGGFVVLDRATNRATAPIEEVDPLLALVGLGLIVVGAITYAFSTRFRAEGMGKSKDAADEDSRNG